MIILVPPGTLVKDIEHGNVIKDLAEDGDQIVIAQGGKGGTGNRRFVSSTNRTPCQCRPEASGLGAGTVAPSITPC